MVCIFTCTAPALRSRPEQSSHQFQQTPSSAVALEGLALVHHRREASHVGEGEDGKEPPQQVRDIVPAKIVMSDGFL